MFFLVENNSSNFYPEFEALTQSISSKANSLPLQYVNCRPHLYFFLQLSQADSAFYDACEDALLVFF